MVYRATLIFLAWKASGFLSVLVMRTWNCEHYGSVCILGGAHTHDIASDSFCAPLQKPLNISADGEMLVVGIFYA